MIYSTTYAHSENIAEIWLSKKITQKVDVSANVLLSWEVSPMRKRTWWSSVFLRRVIIIMIHISGPSTTQP